MTRQEQRVQAIMRMRRMRISMIIGYGVLVALAVISVTIFATTQNERTLQNKISSMTSAMNVQMKLDLDSYLKRVEKVGTLVFSLDEAYTYDATASDNDEYASINTEKAISDQMMRLCLLENFVDYGIVYRNNHTVGKVSNGTTELFGNSLYSDLEDMISRDRTHDGWATGYGGDYARVYYVKRIHDNALLVMSFYTTELATIFDNPDSVSDMTVRLTDQNHKVVYSSIKDEALGGDLPTDIGQYAASNMNGSLIDVYNLVSIDETNVGWHVISSMPTAIVMREQGEMQIYIYIAAGIATILAVLLGWLFAVKISDPMSTVAIANMEED